MPTFKKKLVKAMSGIQCELMTLNALTIFNWGYDYTHKHT